VTVESGDCIRFGKGSGDPGNEEDGKFNTARFNTCTMTSGTGVNVVVAAENPNDAELGTFCGNSFPGADRAANLSAIDPTKPCP